MALYNRAGGHVIETRCPYCSNVGAHRTVKTWPRHSRKARANSPLRDAMDRPYFSRRRTRECCACARQFDTSEFAVSDLDSFKRAHKLTGMQALLENFRISDLERTIRALEAENQALREKQNDVSARVMNTMAELRDPEISRRRIALVRQLVRTDSAASA